MEMDYGIGCVIYDFTHSKIFSGILIAKPILQFMLS